MTDSHPVPRPGAHLRPESAGASAPRVSPDEVSSRVDEILQQVDEVRQAVGDGFDLAALTRQAELLENAHQTLTAALEDVDPR